MKESEGETPRALLRRLIAGENLSGDEAAAFIGAVMDGDYTPVQAAGLLVALAAKGETPDEIAGAARAMRERSVRVEHDFPLVVDVVGTGGDGSNSINISTMAALVVAAAGFPVAKHGNRAASSACGSADVLEAAGLPLEIAPATASEMLGGANFTFLFAPRFHPAMRNAGPIRRELGVRTIFNVLGPLTNPARATHQLVGVAREELVDAVATVLRMLGVERGAVVHAANGLDEVAGDVATRIYSFDESGGWSWVLDPAAYGVDVPLEAIVGGSVDACRAAFFSILGGEPSPAAKVVALNAAVVLYAIGAEARLEDALERASDILRSALALRAFERAKELAVRG
ncbi:MAG: anthranilate phosphoribosyltransferase [Candidatus Eremiobacteraeota bacterium]|nr:anthranilate phosphoribosyltransferase [Candidatus Eremiobacteraeota bacterium]